MFVKQDISFWSGLFFIFGVLINSFWFKSWIYVPLFLIISLFFFLFSNKKVALLLIFLSLGILRSYYSQPVPFIGDEFSGVVVESRPNSSFVLKSNKDKVSVLSNEYVEVNDLVEIKGKVIATDKSYLIKKGIFSSSFFPEVKIKEKGKTSLRKKAQDSLSYYLPSPQSSILQAMLLGQKQEMSQSLSDKLSVSGLRHITAVSGLHVAVVTIIFFNLGLFLGKRKAFLFSLLGIILFVVFTGFHASAIRAGIMGASVITASFLGRMNQSFRALVLAALIMLFFNPMLIRYDIGFQLSFSAVAGIIVFSPFFRKVFSFMPDILRDITATSFSAHVFIVPLLGYYFNHVSLIFPLTNLLVLPFLYWLMLIGIIFVFLSFFSGFLASLLVFPLWLLSSYLIIIADLFSVNIFYVPMSFSFVLFYLLFLIGLFYQRKQWQQELEEKWTI